MLLDLQHIDKAYQMEETSVPVLFDVSLQVEEGDYLAIMGPSGSGKSTLMNIIGCLDLPTAGTFFLNGEDVLKKDDNALSELRNKTIGFVFQNFNLMPRSTALENVALPLMYAGVGRKERNQRAMKALEMVGLGERASFKPTQLSGGQKQRVAIARAMVNNPKLLLADEPTGALDTASGEQVMKLFAELHRSGVTIIMITHAREVAERAEKIVQILDGRLYNLSSEKEAAEDEG